MSPFVLYWPMVLWALGYIEFHLTVFFGPRNGHTLGVSLWIAIAVLLAALWRSRNATLRVAGMLAGEVRRAPVLFWLLCAVQAGMFVLAGYEAHFPPHWPQEGDAINYHMALPRQHLFWGSLQHLPWSAADLWPLALQFGLAPVWFMGASINKWPQLLGALWAFGMILALGRKKAAHSFSGWIPALALFTTHGLMVQLGMAMLDLTNLYLALAAWHAAVHKRPFWWAAHMALYAAAKAFHPAQAGILVVAVLGYLAIFDREGLTKHWRPLVFGAALAFVLFCLMMSRSVWVSIERAGTPIFPFFTCMFSGVTNCQGEAGEAIRATAAGQFGTLDGYGLGRGAGAFVAHLWRISVPALGTVNNVYDYPLGLTWVLSLVLLAGSIPDWIKAKMPPPELVLAVVLWVLWWVTSQQSRWLYPFMAFALLATVHLQLRANRSLLVAILLGAGCLSIVSQARAIGTDQGASATGIQTQQELSFPSDPIALSAKNKETLYVAHAVIEVEKVDTYWILSVESN
jgi:hypothetical protein